MEEMTNLSYSLDGKPDVTLSSYSYGSDSEGITLVVSDILSGLTDGQHTLVVNGLTNWHNAFNSTVTFTVDTSTVIWGKEPPRIFIISPKNETYTNFDTALPLNFSVNEPFVWAKLSLDNKANQTINGNMTIDSSNFFAANSCCHSVKVYAIDTVGNIGASDTIYFTMIFVGWSPQPLPPIVAIISPQNDTYFKSDVLLRFTIDKTNPLDNEFLPTFTNISRISYSLDGENEVTIHGNTTLTGLPDGAHNVIVFAKDTLGNIGVSQTIFFTTKAEPFPTYPVAAVSVVAAVVAVAAVVYLQKRQHEAEPL